MLFFAAGSSAAKCTGASADLEPAQCAYLHDQFVTWKMTRYGCKADDPCACKPYGDDFYIKCEGESGRNTTVTEIEFDDFGVGDDLKGTIGENIGALQDLKRLGLCCNAIGGTIPASMWTLKKLEILSLGDNNLTGTLPDAVGDLDAIKKFEVDHNYLSGSLPASFGNLTDTVKAVGLICNKFTGVLPAIDYDNITRDPTSPTKRVYDCFLSVDPEGVPDYCSDPFGPETYWACPLPDGAAHNCKAKCK